MSLGSTMSAIGRKLPRAVHNAMSAVRPLADCRTAERHFFNVPEAISPVRDVPDAAHYHLGSHTWGKLTPNSPGRHLSDD
jgi:hypothetical protein